jgi:hypothetical protein
MTGANFVMKRTPLFQCGLTFLIIWLASFTPAPGGAVRPGATAAVAPTSTEPAVTNTPAATSSPEPAGTASHGGPVRDYVSLVDNLRAAGATVEPVGEMEQAFFTPVGYVIRVNGTDVQVFEYPDAEAAGAEAALVSDDGTSIGTTMVTWLESPHFYQLERIIVLHVGEEHAITALLESLLGPQIAGR